MANRARVFAVTGDDVVRFELTNAGTTGFERLLGGVGARCLVVDPHDPGGCTSARSTAAYTPPPTAGACGETRAAR